VAATLFKYFNDMHRLVVVSFIITQHERLSESRKA